MRKTLEDFKNEKGEYDYQAFADYLESSECANDDDYDIYVDEKGNIYERTDGDWTEGHGHTNVYNGYTRKPEDPNSKNRKWKNPWLKYAKKLNLNEEEIKLLNFLCLLNKENNSDKLHENKVLLKK